MWLKEKKISLPLEILKIPFTNPTPLLLAILTENHFLRNDFFEKEKEMIIKENENK
jgi:hypothetical protein